MIGRATGSGFDLYQSPRCNYRCGFCALRTREVQPKRDMDFGLFKRITRGMREAGVEETGLFYLCESFIEAWNSTPFVALRAAHLRKDVTGTLCEKCVAYQ